MNRWRVVFDRGILALSCALGGTALASTPWIDMGVKDDFAFDQPQVTFELRSANGATSYGPNGDDGLFGSNNIFILDTGASSILALNAADDDLHSHAGYVTENQIDEQGVAGFSTLDVSAPYQVKVTDSGNATTTLQNTRILSGQIEGLLGTNGVVGMPAMVGRVVTLDESVWASFDPGDIFSLQSLDVHLSNTLPASNGHRYSVPIHAKRFDATGNPPLPASSPVSLFTMSMGSDNHDASGSFLLDTGASISIISTRLAKQLGLDSNGDGVLGAGDARFSDTLPIGGIGDEIEAPLFAIDRITVPTDQGVNLVWHADQATAVIVVDIDDSIDGVFGADAMTSGWIDLDGILTGETSGKPGPVQQVYFDFRQLLEEGDTGKMYFDLTSSVDVVLPGGLAGDYNGDGVVDGRDYTLWRDTLGSTTDLAADGNGNHVIDQGDFAVWQRGSSPGVSTGGPVGDYNGDGVVDALDYVVWRDNLGSTTNFAADGDGNGVVDGSDYTIWKNRFGTQLGAGGGGLGTGQVPEPSTLGMLITAAICIAASRSRIAPQVQ